ncbi:uncharacterized protein LOC126366395 [Pectinophora gossypiella]|uniref:uncharacterized protein LOC126366395 n=1 Tax=Pectinophora gossypiella TaxID=13191 RepID=UPI00214E14D5|nr:uncharacterized protein LOC126366395 [Pectinophora gossypiella]
MMRMDYKLATVMLGVLQLAAALPALTLQDLEVADDTMSVGSYIREVRAAAPQDYHKTYENEGDGEIGYSRKKSGGGKKGYQHFDSYHKKAGDNYEFEKQDSFGLDKEDESGAHSHPQEQRVERPQGQSRKYREAEVPYEDTPEYERYEEEPEQHEKTAKKKKHQKKEKEPHYEELKEGASDGNGGVEARGHDPRDYILPEKYTWDEEEA